MISANTRNNILNQFLDSNDKKISAILKNLLYQSNNVEPQYKITKWTIDSTKNPP